MVNNIIYGRGEGVWNVFFLFVCRAITERKDFDRFCEKGNEFLVDLGLFVWKLQVLLLLFF